MGNGYNADECVANRISFVAGELCQELGRAQAIATENCV